MNYCVTDEDISGVGGEAVYGPYRSRARAMKVAKKLIKAYLSRQLEGDKTFNDVISHDWGYRCILRVCSGRAVAGQDGDNKDNG